MNESQVVLFRRNMPGTSFLNIDLRPLASHHSQNLRRVQRASQILTCKHSQNHLQLSLRNSESTRRPFANGFDLPALISPFTSRLRNWPLVCFWLNDDDSCAASVCGSSTGVLWVNRHNVEAQSTLDAHKLADNSFDDAACIQCERCHLQKKVPFVFAQSVTSTCVQCELGLNTRSAHGTRSLAQA